MPDDKPTWTRHGDTEVAEWRGIYAEMSWTDGHFTVVIIVKDKPRAALMIKEWTEDAVKRDAESLMRLHAERDEQARELSRLRERVEVLEEIAEDHEYGDWDHQRDCKMCHHCVARHLYWRGDKLVTDPHTPDCPYTRLAELDKETDDAEA